MTSSTTINMRLAAIAAAGILLLGALAAAYTSTLAHADTATSTPAITNVVATPSATGATITWSSDQLGSTQVLYGPSAGVYNASSTLSDVATGTMSHTAFLGGLIPSTTYHFAVLTQNASSTVGSSTDMMFTTLASSTSTTTASTSPPAITNIMVVPTTTAATISWNTNVFSNSQVAFGLTSSYGSASPLSDTGGGVTAHSVTLTGLSPSTLYHFAVFSTAGSSTQIGSSTDMTFTTSILSTSTGTSTGSSTSGTDDDSFLQSQITNLQNRVSTLEQQIASLLSGTSTGTTTGNTGSNPTGASIDQNGATITAGSSIDFGGRNFGHEENVTIMLSGNTVTVAHADGGGNFSTGSIAGPTAPGTYTYRFLGQSSGDNLTATIIVQ